MTYLSDADVATVLASVTYRPGWSFGLIRDPHEGLQVRIVARGVPNSYRPDETIDLGITSWLPPQRTAEDLLDWLLWRLQRIESHECREWLRHDGELVSDPHEGTDDELPAMRRAGA